MTVDEIKQTYSMRDVLARYGIQPNRSGFVPCPFHQEKTGSMKIYKDSFHCFGCGANGDIFSFIQQMDNCDFKTAFYSLGGTYEKPTKASQIAVYHAQKAKEKRKREEQKLKEKIYRNNMDLRIYKTLLDKSKPLSDDWWYYLDKYHMAVIRDINYEGGN